TEIDGQQDVARWREAQSQEMRRGARQAELPDELTVMLPEHIDLPETGDRARAVEAESRHVHVAVGPDRNPLRAGRALRQDRKRLDVATIPGGCRNPCHRYARGSEQPYEPRSFRRTHRVLPALVMLLRLDGGLARRPPPGRASGKM